MHQGLKTHLKSLSLFYIDGVVSTCACVVMRRGDMVVAVHIVVYLIVNKC